MENETRSLGDIVRDLVQDFTTLLREEVALAKAEIRQTISEAVSDSILVVVGGVLAFVALLALVAAAILGLATTVAPWLSALIIGGIILLVAVVLIMVGINRFKKLSVTPERTVRTIREDIREVKERL